MQAGILGVCLWFYRNGWPNKVNRTLQKYGNPWEFVGIYRPIGIW